MLEIKNCTQNQFEQIKNYIQQFQLDDRQLDYKQFLVAQVGENIVGFGRVREFNNCSELCSLGVVEPERHKGIGKALTKALINKANKQLYLVCIIPHFFLKLGFKISFNFPSEIETKLNYCTQTLVVNESYVVMKL